ncbi:hypothetical protein BDZ89DRAFT_1063543 [Hymenopellis radicata]|nr:hypothetical protein BDZ89DRAFT_1063543 [Hymenopellis radicata]
MRFRIQAESPLPVTKAWFSCTENESITNLKNAKTKSESLTLELDGFELLDILETGSIVREGDLIIVKQKGNLLGLKRKATPTAEKSAKKAKYTHPSSSSSSSVSSSSSDSSSSDSSDSESDSSSDGPPVKKPIGRKPPQPLQSNVPSNQHHVPPGQGRHQTRSRNLRRRVKKQHEQALASGIPFETPPPPPKNLSTTNLQPLGEPNGDSALNLSMFSLGNKNKKKGYKQALEKPATAKIVFNSDEPSSSISTPPTKSAPTQSFPFNQQRLIPPSEREDLPSNMFVTSVDVEEGMWGKTRKNRRKRKMKCDVSLDYGDPAPSSEELLWKHAETSFELKSPAASTDIQELALNPATFSPEIMLILARVVALAKDGCTVRKLVRPGYEVEEEPLDETLSFGDMVAQSMRFMAGSAS